MARTSRRSESDRDALLNRYYSAFDDPYGSDPGDSDCEHSWSAYPEYTPSGTLWKTICLRCYAYRPATTRERLRYRIEVGSVASLEAVRALCSPHLWLHAAAALLRWGSMHLIRRLGRSIPLVQAPLPGLGSESGFTGRSRRVLDTPLDWLKASHQAGARMLAPVSPAPLDLERWSVLLTSMGVQTSTGSATWIEGVFRRGPVQVVIVREAYPDESAVRCPWYAPADAVLVPKFQGKTWFLTVESSQVPDYVASHARPDVSSPLPGPSLPVWKRLQRDVSLTPADLDAWAARTPGILPLLLSNPHATDDLVQYARMRLVEWLESGTDPHGARLALESFIHSPRFSFASEAGRRLIAAANRKDEIGRIARSLLAQAPGLPSDLGERFSAASD